MNFTKLLVPIYLLLPLVVISNVFVIWSLAKQGKKKLMYTLIAITVIGTIYSIIEIVDVYNGFKSM